MLLQSPTTPCYRSLLHHVSLTCGRVQTYPGHICIPCQSTLVLHSPTTPSQFDMWKDAHISRTHVSPCSLHLVLQSPTTLSVWDVQECRHNKLRPTPSMNWTQCYTALLHHLSLTCGRMHTYPGHMYLHAHCT